MKEKVHQIIEQLISHDIGKNEAVELVNEMYVGYKPKYKLSDNNWMFCHGIEILKTPKTVKDQYEVEYVSGDIFKIDALDLDYCDDFVKIEKRLLNSLKTKPE